MACERALSAFDTLGGANRRFETDLLHIAFFVNRLAELINPCGFELDKFVANRTGKG
jgi:hypothetical protein